jgi:hypothetical protein
VVLGTALAVVGAGVITAMLIPTPGPDQVRTGSAAALLAPGQNQTLFMSDDATGSGSLTLDWQASAPVLVSWYAVIVCPDATGYCIDSNAVQNWTAGPAGNGTMHGSIVGTYCVEVTNSGAAPANFSAGLVESYPGTSHALPMLAIVWTIAAGSILVGIGAMSVYLGLFLPSGVYAAPRPEGLGLGRDYPDSEWDDD